MQHRFGTHTLKLRLTKLRKFRERKPAGPEGMAEHKKCGETLGELECPSFEAHMDRSSLLLFHNICFSAVFVEEDKYITPTHSSKVTRSSDSAEYCWYQTYSYVLKKSFYSKLFHIGKVLLLLQPLLSTHRSIAISFSQKHSAVNFKKEPVREISNNMVCATSKASDQPAHTRSLIRAFASRLSILWLLSYWLNTIWSF